MHWLIVGLFVSMVMFMMVPTDVQAQGNKVVAADLTVPDGAAGQIYVRNKRPDGLSRFSSDRIAIMVHGATYPATAFDLPFSRRTVSQSWCTARRIRRRLSTCRWPGSRGWTTWPSAASTCTRSTCRHAYDPDGEEPHAPAAHCTAVPRGAGAGARGDPVSAPHARSPPRYLHRRGGGRLANRAHQCGARRRPGARRAARHARRLRRVAAGWRSLDASGRDELWQRLLGRPASESGRLCHGDGAHEWGARRRRALTLPILRRTWRTC